MKYKSPLLTSATGSVGGLNASNNKGGNYFRAKPHPKATGTNNRSRAQGSLGALANLWATLTDNERDSWDNYAFQVKMPKRPGSIHTLSGYAHFIRSNVWRQEPFILYPLVRVAPTIFTLPGHLVKGYTYIFRVSSGPQTGLIYFGLIATTLAGNYSVDYRDLCLFYVSKPFNVGKSSYHGSFHYAAQGIYPEEGGITLNVAFPTGHYMAADSSFKMLLNVTYAFFDGRTSFPQRFEASYP